MKKNYFFKIMVSFIAFFYSVNFNQLNAQVELVVEGLDSSYCPSASDVIMSAYPYGGVFSGPGVTDNIFSPTAAGAGVHEVSYIIDTIVYQIEIQKGINPIQGSGYQVNLSDDNISSTLDLGFDFNFFGNVYSSIVISSNGFLSFDPSSNNGCCSGQIIPNSDNPNNLIAFAWEDLNPSLGGTIDYFTIGNTPNQIFVVNFRNIQHYGGGYPITTQIQLLETSNTIKVLTTNMNSDYGNHTMGVENVDGTLAYVVKGRNSETNWSAFDELVTFKPIEVSDTAIYIVKVEDTGSSMTLSDTSLNFGEIFTGYPQELSINLINTGCDNIVIDSVRHNTADYINLTVIPVIVLTEDELTYNIRFNPALPGIVTDTFFIYTSLVDTFITVTGSSILNPEYSTDIALIYDTISNCSGTAADTFYIYNSSLTSLQFNILASIKFNDDFEDENVTDWVSTSDFFSLETSSINGAGGNYALKFTGNQDWSYNDGAIKLFSNSSPGYAKLRIRPDWELEASAGFSIGSESDITNGGSINGYFSHYGRFSFVILDGNQLQIDSSDWYNIELKNIDFLSQTYDFYLNGKMLQENMGFRHNNTEFSAIMLYNYLGGITYFDDIYMGSEVEWLNVTPTEGLIATGDSVRIIANINSDGLVAGNNVDQLIISTNDQDNLINAFDINLFVEVDAELNISVPSIDFGNVFLNGVATDTIVLSSLNCNPVSIDSIVIDSAAFNIYPVGVPVTEIIQGNPLELVVTFAATALRDYNGIIRIYTEAMVDTIEIFGNGIAAPEITLSEIAIYDTIFACSGFTPKSFTIENTGGNNLEYDLKIIHQNNSVSSEQYFGSGANTVHELQIFEPLTNLVVTVTVNGDYTDASSEFATVYANGIYLGELPSDGDNIDITAIFQIPDTLIQTINNDEVIEITVQNSVNVDAGWDNDLHTVELDAYYITLATVVPDKGILTPGVSEEITVTVGANEFISGNYNNKLIISSNDPVSPMDTINIELTIDGIPGLEVQTSCIDFGKIRTGQTKNDYFELTNTGCDTLFISSIVSSVDFASIPISFVLPQNTVIIPVSITPSVDSVYVNEVFVVNTNIDTLEVCITAESVSGDAVSFVSTDSINMIEACSNNQSESFYIKNTGNADLIFNISVEGGINGILLLSDSSGVLVSEDSLTINLLFDGIKTFPGTYGGRLVITNNESLFNPDTIFVTIVDSFFYVANVAIESEVSDLCLGESTILVASDGFISYNWSQGSSEQQIVVDSSAAYRVTSIDYNGCESSDIHQIAVHQPKVNLGPDQNACQGDELTLSAGNEGTVYLWSNGDTTQLTLVNSTGTYYVDVTDNYNCSNSDSILIVINSLPVADLGVDQTIKTSDSLVLNPGMFTSYLWSTSETTQTIEIIGSVVGAGVYTYSVEVKNEFNCSNSDSVLITIESTGGINEDLAISSSASVYPNPATSFANIEFNVTADKVEYAFLTIDGKTISKNTLNNVTKGSLFKMDISQLPKGVYFIVLNINEEQLEYKLIVE